MWGGGARSERRGQVCLDKAFPHFFFNGISFAPPIIRLGTHPLQIITRGTLNPFLLPSPCQTGLLEGCSLSQHYPNLEGDPRLTGEDPKDLKGRPSTLPEIEALAQHESHPAASGRGPHILTHSPGMLGTVRGRGYIEIRKRNLGRCGSEVLDHCSLLAHPSGVEGPLSGHLGPQEAAVPKPWFCGIGSFH